MNGVELILLMLAACVALAIVANRIGLPYPIVLVLGGIALAFAPGIPRLELRPDVALVVFLPPLLFSAAWLTSWRDFRANLRDIGMLAIGLVVATTAGVAAVAHALVPDMPWGVAFVLGAIVSPPDAVAATSVMQRLRVPPRLVTLLEGESLVNDATGLVAYELALAVVAGGHFSAVHAAGRFALVGLGGTAFGLAVGWAVAQLHRRLDDFQVETLISLLTPYVAYIPAEHLGVSGVLSTVTAGGFLAWRSPKLLSPLVRLRSWSVWSAVLFLFNGLVFILIGQELAGAHRRFAAMSTTGLVTWCLAVAGTTIAIRLLWVPIVMHLPHKLLHRLRREPAPAWKDTIVVAWTAMRGIVSLALALALPEALPDGTPFPQRELLVLLVSVVIAVTLLGQGLTLPLLIRALGFVDDGAETRRERAALVRSTENALARLEQIASGPGVEPRTAAVLRAIYERRLDRLRASERGDPSGERVTDERASFSRLRGQLIEAERETFISLRDGGAISEEALQRLQRELDVESVQPLR